MPVERRERAIAIDQVNCGRVTGRRKSLMINGRRQSSCDGTSRMNREVHVRFCERLGVQFPGPTRHKRTSRPAWTLSALPPKADIERHGWHVRLVVRPKSRHSRCSNFLFDHLVGEREELGRKRRHGAGQARAGYLVRSIKVSTACITEVCGLRKQ